MPSGWGCLLLRRCWLFRCRWQAGKRQHRGCLWCHWFCWLPCCCRVLGKKVYGARRWIGLGPLSFQPSELAKFTVLLYAADYMVRKMEVKERFFRAVLPMGAAVAVVGVLLLAEPDMGAFMVIAVIAMGILFLGGVNARMFFLIAAVLLVAFSLMIATSEWRRERIFAYLDPWSEKMRWPRAISSRIR
jgi:cell division protein FtsW (lipid II flippase)